VCDQAPTGLFSPPAQVQRCHPRNSTVATISGSQPVQLLFFQLVQGWGRLRCCHPSSYSRNTNYLLKSFCSISVDMSATEAVQWEHLTDVERTCLGVAYAR
jgi:hypothetical protein